MFGIGYQELLILSVLGLGCVGAVAAIAVVAVLAAGRRGAAPGNQDVVRCPQCGAVRPAADRFCGACGQPLKLGALAQSF